MAEYKCKDCKKIDTLLTLGDMYNGCANCGGSSGFLKREDKKKKWEDVQKTGQTDALSRFMDEM